MNRILITGAAGFVGFHLSQRLLDEGHEVYGIDNLNDYYDPALKYARLASLGVQSPKEKVTLSSSKGDSFRFQQLDLQDYSGLDALFSEIKPEIVINLAAQAGVRYSLENPRSYIESNVDGFFNILEASRQHKVQKFLYASSSSVYGNNEKSPFAEGDGVDHPVSLYAATKKSNELIAHTYSHLYKMTTVGLRFFTVYGPWGRPDMAYYFFTKAIIEGKQIQLFNNGLNLRDYTYIDDIVESINRMVGALDKLQPDGTFDQYNAEQSPFYHIYNIGGSNPVPVLEFVETLEQVLRMKANAKLVGFQPGDVYSTEADTRSLESWINFKPSISLREGLAQFIEWYKQYHK